MAEHFSIPWYQSNNIHICAYATFLHHYKKFSANSIRTVLSALGHFFKIHSKQNPTKSEPLQKLLTAYSKDLTQDKRKPIDKNILAKLLRYCLSNSHDQYYQDAFYLIYTLMYKLALRISEISNYTTHYNHAIEIEDVQVANSSHLVCITIRSAKHSKGSKTFQLKANERLLSTLDRFAAARGNQPGQLFIHESGAPFTRSFIAKRLANDLKAIGKCPELLNSHSLRIGRTCDVARERHSDWQIAEIRSLLKTH